jgi:hypothetical protein
MCKYREARDLCDQMTRRFPEHRLNCEEILAQKNLWALSDNEFDPVTVLRNVPNFNLIEHFFNSLKKPITTLILNN